MLKIIINATILDEICTLKIVILGVLKKKPKKGFLINQLA